MASNAMLLISLYYTYTFAMFVLNVYGFYAQPRTDEDNLGDVQAFLADDIYVYHVVFAAMLSMRGLVDFLVWCVFIYHQNQVPTEDLAPQLNQTLQNEMRTLCLAVCTTCFASPTEMAIRPSLKSRASTWRTRPRSACAVRAPGSTSSPAETCLCCATTRVVVASGDQTVRQKAEERRMVKQASRRSTSLDFPTSAASMRDSFDDDEGEAPRRRRRRRRRARRTSTTRRAKRAPRVARPRGVPACLGRQAARGGGDAIVCRPAPLAR